MIFARAIAVAICLAGSAVAQPSRAPLGPSILETGSAIYETKAITLPGPEGGAAYRIGVLTPRRSAPEAGFPVLYLLDGQAALDLLRDDLLARFPQDQLPVIVTLGYDVDTRIAGDDRTRDYTPPDPDGQPVADPRGRPAGQADRFLSRLSQTILPAAEALVPVDPGRRMLWGHSYGGLFVLYAASRGDAPFSSYVAASPSLWWDDARFLTRLRTQIGSGDWPSRPLQVITDGGAVSSRSAAGSPDPSPERSAFQRMRAALPDHAAADLVALARNMGHPADHVAFPEMSHGQTFAASIKFLLEAGF